MHILCILNTEYNEVRLEKKNYRINEIKILKEGLEISKAKNGRKSIL